MCLLIALFREVAGAPLLVAANRDELYARPAVTMTVLRDAGPRILGGRDELAGGTWLAVNEHGVVAGLTNQPSAGRDAGKRSRGELPLAFAACASAAQAVAAVTAKLDPADYNPCWMLVGDRDALFSVGLADGREPGVEQLSPGMHVLQNAPFRAPSPKTAQVTAMAAEELAAPASAGAAADALAAVLCDHRPAPGFRPVTLPSGRVLPAGISAACVHTPDYGTRSSMIVTVPAAGLPRLRVADGPPCQVPLRDVTSLWASVPAG
jgi:uncharacterized protein with NRDE domain